MSGQMMENFDARLNVFEPSTMQLAITNSWYQEFTPISALGAGQPIQFVMNGVPKQVWDLKNSFMVVRAQLTKGDGTSILNTDVSVINNALYSAFSQVDAVLDDKPISDSNPFLPYRCYLENLLGYDQSVHKGWMEKSSIFVKDTAGEFGVFAKTGNNQGLNARAGIFATSAQVDMMGRLPLDIAHQEQFILDNSKLELRFIPSRDNFVLMSPAPTGDGATQELYKLKIVEMKLYILTLEISDAVSLAISKMLETDNARWFINKTSLKIVTIPEGLSNIMQDNAFLGKLPKRLTIAFVTDASMAGGYQQNPFNFQHFGLSQLGLRVNGNLVPNRPYTPDFTNNRYIREYMGLHEGLRMLFTNRALDITYDEFRGGYAIFVFDLTQNKNGDPAPPLTGTLRIEGKFSTALTATVQMILFAEFDAVIYKTKTEIISPY